MTLEHCNKSKAVQFAALSTVSKDRTVIHKSISVVECSKHQKYSKGLDTRRIDNASCIIFRIFPQFFMADYYRIVSYVNRFSR